MATPKTLFLVPSLARAGAEKQVVDLVNGLAAGGFRCHLASFEEDRDQLDRTNLQAVVYHPLSRRSKLDWGLVRRLATIIDSEEIDILHCTLSIAVLYGYLATRFSGCKPRLVAGIHTTISRTRKDEYLEQWVYRWILRSAAKVVFVCQMQRDYWVVRDPRLAQNSAVIYNGVDSDFFSRPLAKAAGDELRTSLGLSADSPMLCCIAAFRPEKAQGNILRGLAALGDRFGTAHAVFAGQGSEQARIKTLAAELNLGERTHFLGNIPDVRPVLAAADFSVIASTAVETFSFAMLESMAMATPVLSSRIGGAAEAIIPGETGFLVEPGNVDDLAEAMALLLGDRRRTQRLGENARNKVKQMFSMKTMIDQTGKLISEL